MTKDITLEEFLAPISRRLGHDAVAESVPRCAALSNIPERVHLDSASELQQKFISAAEAMHVKVHVCAAEDVDDVICGIVANADPATDGIQAGVVLPNVEEVAQYGLVEAFESAGISYGVWHPERGREVCRALCLKAQFGVTFPQAAVAETGSVVQPCSEDCGRSISLLPETHIAVIKSDSIVPHMVDVLRDVAASGGPAGANLPSQVCFISGPSNTSDIELVRVEGVHGPMYVHYVVIETAGA